jgi:hypothetical protein
MSNKAEDSVLKPHGRRIELTSKLTIATEMAKPITGFKTLRNPMPLAFITIISESPHIRAKASITPRSAAIGNAISKKVGIMAKKTLAI